MVNNSTDYYRKNRRIKRVKYSCPHCSYHTYNCKIALTHHINSRHVNEANRPFQCTECSRGFAQKAHLVHHLQQKHDGKNTRMHAKVSTIMYIIDITDLLPSTKKTKARQLYYKTHPVIKSRDIYNKQHEYMKGVFLKNHDLHYDLKKNFITLHKVPLKEGFHITTNNSYNIVVRL